MAEGRRATALWTTHDRTRHFLIPDGNRVEAGDLTLRTSTGREQAVDEASVAQYEVSEAEAQAWAKEQLSATLGEMRGRVLGFADELKARTAKLREENRRAWEEGVANAPPELREAAGKARSRLRDLGQALQRVARENLERERAKSQPAPDAQRDADAPERPDADRTSADDTDRTT
jgi:hypothetical protein